MRVLATAAGALLLALLAPSAHSAPPTGQRTARPIATHVVVEAAQLDASGAVAQVAPGVGVVVAATGPAAVSTAPRDAPLPRGRVHATLAADAELAGEVDSAALGERVLTDTDLFDSTNLGERIGRARAGGLVKVVGRGRDGKVVVETVGDVHARVALAASALGAEPREQLLPAATTAMLVGSAEVLVYPKARAAGPPRARVAAGAWIALTDTSTGEVVPARTVGDFAIDGFIERRAVGEPTQERHVASPAARGRTPTHEALLDVDAFADPDAKHPVGRLRGGTLVAAGEERGGRVKVMTHGDTVVEVWVGKDGLRPLAAGEWSKGL